ncbi:MAG: FAD-dependent monooxygenase [Alphaproteobacteria bacterium]|nr:FAD-dependent monooxygenase [Alphaproteobacteria bacterium]
MNTYDIAIIGGGLAGLAAAVTLAKKGHATVLFAPKGPIDRRTSALMRPSVDFLVRAGLIGSAEGHGEPLTAIRIIDATARLIRGPETLFRAGEIGASAFGWNFANAPLLAHFAEQAAALPGLSVIEAPASGFVRTAQGFEIALASGAAVTAFLLVGADGKRSPVRQFAGIAAHERTFAEAALVADLELARPLDGESVEFHYEHGPFTLVPAGGNRANLVWIDRRDVLETATAGNLATALAERSRNLFGALAVSGPAAIFPLSMLSVATAGRDGIALVGEAAHAFPPIGAQGLNLGLRDVADLVDALDGADLSAPGSADTVSRDYATRRAADLMRTGGGVEALFRSLVADFLPVQAARAGGLWALKLVPGLRRAAMHAGMGTRRI